ncbi:type I-B CRISPR-associated protein Cas7/Csh2 [Methanocaldococcus infernus]|uniref:CRISPR-associated protein, Csh2 family n=1 Tax=Methanocaldococcus infernus (strain DSM 11812 / JCM 15783 / ME) TaxID=573063 RepID=D5VTE6_METIM|nr:type I-B CRISPR-associated protein Cas7/Csh2 [Methanocaldococcus infernus]ADG13849.1 CRISPR-associated protein, Csh2 family [Methanocaldococcus infernus ME]
MIKRSEILFLYDVKDANPNGDPLDENKPRIDEETGINIVTDVRLKRTIRDYLDSIGEDIFIKEVRDEKGELKTKEDRLKELKIEKEEDLLKLIDIRLFGATIAVKGNPIALTGPVQFRFGRSLHRVSLKLIKGTTVMPSKEGKSQGTFTEYWVVPYSLIAFYGIINENAAKTTKLTEEDIKKLIEAMWNGTKNLISRSKVGHTPRLLIKVNYKEKNYHIGDLDRSLKLISNVEDEKIRDVKDYKLDLTELINLLKENKDKIESIEYIWDKRLKLVYNGEEFDFKTSDLPFKEITL